MKIQSDFNNSLLKRREIVAVLDSDSNPGFSRVLEEIVKKFNVSVENVAIKKIVSGFGESSFVVEFFIYESAQDKEKIEPKKKVKKGAGVEPVSK